ncbi:unnamed protein product [Penicillium pancosmium]
MSRGLDEGLISTTVAQNSFINEFGLQAKSLDASQQANRLSNITSMVHIGSIPGALIAFLLCERVGMLWSMRQLCTLWMAGVIVVITASGKLGQIYAGRFIMGLGIGQAGVVAPTYLAEIAPQSARGMLVSVFGMSEYIGIMIGVSILRPADTRKDANNVEAYAPELFALFGINGQSEKLFTTAIFGAVKFVASLLCAILLIDHIGRKRSLISGIAVQQVAMLYIAMYLTINASLAGDESPSSKRAALGAIVFIYFVGIGWAMGWNSIQYLLNAEIFPLRVRATGSSLLMCFHYVNRYGLSKAVPSMLLQSSLQPEGTFWFFSIMTFFGLLWAWILLPETAGQTLEDTNGLFG